MWTDLHLAFVAGGHVSRYSSSGRGVKAAPGSGLTDTVVYLSICSIYYFLYHLAFSSLNVLAPGTEVTRENPLLASVPAVRK